jgi:hypothetical protein
MGDVCVLGLIRGGKGSLIALTTAVRKVSTFCGGDSLDNRDDIGERVDRLC